jgi:hypothetical protein
MRDVYRYVYRGPAMPYRAWNCMGRLNPPTRKGLRVQVPFRAQAKPRRNVGFLLVLSTVLHRVYNSQRRPEQARIGTHWAENVYRNVYR